MAATKLQANWTAVSLGTTHHPGLPGELLAGRLAGLVLGRCDLYPTVVVNLMSRHRASVTGADTATLMGVAPGTSASFSATHKVAMGATGGDILYVMADAVAENVETSGSADFGSATMQLLAFSSDGTTNPLSLTRA